MGQEKAGCLGFLFRLFPGLSPGGEGGAPAGAELPKVMVNNRFITPAEANFFRVLRALVGERGHVLAQVSLKQLLYFPAKGDPDRQRWQNKVAQKSVDFVMCDPNTLKPKVVIELDEPSHARRTGRRGMMTRSSRIRTPATAPRGRSCACWRGH